MSRPLPVDADIGRDKVDHLNQNPVALPCSDPGTGELPVHRHHALRVA